MPHVLVIDDDDQFRSFMVAALRKAGFNVVAVECARDIDEVLQNDPFDLIITDILMPDVEGIEIVQIIRSRGILAKVLVVSGGSRDSPLDYLDFALKLGADAALAKPFLPAELLVTVRDLLSRTAVSYA